MFCLCLCFIHSQANYNYLQITNIDSNRDDKIFSMDYFDDT